MNVLTVSTWPQHFQAMSEEQLKREITLKGVRHTQLRETNGRPKADGWRIYAGHIVKLFQEEFSQYIEYSKMDEDRLLSIAKTWAVQLEQEYIAYGVDGIRAAMRSYVAQDASVYYRFPKVGQIKAECGNLHGSPEHELGLREQQRQEAQMEARDAAAWDAWKMQHPEEWERIKEEAARREAAQHGRISA